MKVSAASRTPRRIRSIAATAVVASLGGLLVALATPVAAADPPPNPTNGQISAAQAHKNALADQVGRLSGQVADMQAKLQQLQGDAELAEQKYAYAKSQAELAVAQAKKERIKFAATNKRVAGARLRLLRYVQASYMSSSVGGNAEALLTAADPSSLLEQSAIKGYAASHQIDAIGGMERANIAQSNQAAATKLAEQKAKKLLAAAKQAKTDAENAVAAAAAQEAQLRQTLSSTQTALSSAQATLASLNHQRAAYDAYQAHQRYLRALARKRAAEARRRAEEERRRHHQNGGGGSSTPIQSSGGSWSAARGRDAVRRALSQLGTPYAWAGGNSGGPTYGVCVSGDAWNDCHIVGYDCSGLAMYAWGPYESLPHLASLQYVVAGSYHPGAGNLRPGDLVFWSNTSSPGAIHHVAIYIGNGQIVEAPYSGSYVRTASLYEYGSAFFTTRPLT